MVMGAINAWIQTEVLKERNWSKQFIKCSGAKHISQILLILDGDETHMKSIKAIDIGHGEWCDSSLSVTTLHSQNAAPRT